jgi:DNA-binding response OmpR family regulator
VNYRKIILHVNDDPQLTRLVAQHLQPLGYELTSLNDPTQALRMLGQSHYRLVLLDIDMPRVNGLELLRKINRTHSGSQVIMLSGLVSMLTLLQSYRWGAEHCIFKPLLSVAPLLEAVAAVFRKIDHWHSALEQLHAQPRVADSGDGWQFSITALDVPVSQLLAPAGQLPPCRG